MALLRKSIELLRRTLATRGPAPAKTAARKTKIKAKKSPARSRRKQA